MHCYHFLMLLSNMLWELKNGIKNCTGNLVDWNWLIDWFHAVCESDQHSAALINASGDKSFSHFALSGTPARCWIEVLIWSDSDLIWSDLVFTKRRKKRWQQSAMPQKNNGWMRIWTVSSFNLAYMMSSKKTNLAYINMI